TNAGQPVALPSGAIVTAQSNGSFTYDPNGGFNSLGPSQSTADSFTYTDSDGQGNIGTATVTIRIAGTNDAPVLTSNGGGDAATLAVDENETVVTKLQ